MPPGTRPTWGRPVVAGFPDHRDVSSTAPPPGRRGPVSAGRGAGSRARTEQSRAWRRNPGDARNSTRAVGTTRPLRPLVQEFSGNGPVARRTEDRPGGAERTRISDVTPDRQTARPGRLRRTRRDGPPLMTVRPRRNGNAGSRRAPRAEEPRARFGPVGRHARRWRRRLADTE